MTLTHATQIHRAPLAFCICYAATISLEVAELPNNLTMCINQLLFEMLVIE